MRVSDDRLEGHEIAWTEAGDIRVARYSNLPPGDYHFQVMACNEDGVWNEAGAMLAVSVLPPFWRTWWFLSATSAKTEGARTPPAWRRPHSKHRLRCKPSPESGNHPAADCYSARRDIARLGPSDFVPSSRDLETRILGEARFRLV